MSHSFCVLHWYHRDKRTRHCPQCRTWVIYDEKDNSWSRGSPPEDEDDNTKETQEATENDSYATSMLKLATTVKSDTAAKSDVGDFLQSLKIQSDASLKRDCKGSQPMTADADTQDLDHR